MTAIEEQASRDADALESTLRASLVTRSDAELLERAGLPLPDHIHTHIVNLIARRERDAYYQEAIRPAVDRLADIGRRERALLALARGCRDGLRLQRGEVDVDQLCAEYADDRP